MSAVAHPEDYNHNIPEANQEDPGMIHEDHQHHYDEGHPHQEGEYNEEGQEEGGEEEQVPIFDPNGLKVSIKSTDMSENMILFVIEKTILAFEVAAYTMHRQEEGAKLDENTLIAKVIKNEMEMFYDPSWHVIVGQNYGSYFTHEEFNSIVFVVKNKWITVFKSNIPLTDDQD